MILTLVVEKQALLNLLKQALKAQEESTGPETKDLQKTKPKTQEMQLNYAILSHDLGLIQITFLSSAFIHAEI